jgi:hypothetical protein
LKTSLGEYPKNPTIMIPIIAARKVNLNVALNNNRTKKIPTIRKIIEISGLGKKANKSFI